MDSLGGFLSFWLGGGVAGSGKVDLHQLPRSWQDTIAIVFESALNVLSAGACPNVNKRRSKQGGSVDRREQAVVRVSEP